MMGRLAIDDRGLPILLADDEEPAERPERRPWWIRTPERTDAREREAPPRRRLLRRSRTA